MESKNTCVEVFGKRLKELRKANGYTIEQFAEAVGISKSTVGYYENNNRMPDIEILSRIAGLPYRQDEHDRNERQNENSLRLHGFVRYGC